MNLGSLLVIGLMFIYSFLISLRVFCVFVIDCLSLVCYWLSRLLKMVDWKGFEGWEEGFLLCRGPHAGG